MEDQNIFVSQTLCDDIFISAKEQLDICMSKWCTSYENNSSGGEMRSERGADIEKFIRDSINNIGVKLKKNLKAVRGTGNEKLLRLHYDNKELIKKHQVDVHIYLDDKFIAVIECKAYLDHCYYVRACDDFKLFKKFGHDIKCFIFALENSVDESSKLFTDVITDHVCDEIFYVLDGKRSSSKPIYDSRYKKQINETKLKEFINSMVELCTPKTSST